MTTTPPCAAQAVLHQRLTPPRDGRLDVLSGLAHFALVTYALPAERLRRYIPAERFIIPEFPINGQRLALMSAVPFVDVDFHFLHWKTAASRCKVSRASPLSPRCS